MKVSILDRDDAHKDQLAALLAEGVKNADIAEVFGVHKDTVSEWKKRPDIQARVSRIIEQRSNSILAHTDTAIQKRLEQARDSNKPLPMELLLRIRQTFAGEKVTINTEGDKSAAVADLMRRLHDEPELAREIAAESDDSD